MNSISLTVKDLIQSIDFYHRRLGFTLIHQTSQSASLVWEQQTLHLTQGQSQPQACLFHTDHIEILEQRVINHHIKFVRPPYIREEETETFNKVFHEWTVEDLDGHALTFSSFTHFRC